MLIGFIISRDNFKKNKNKERKSKKVLRDKIN